MFDWFTANPGRLYVVGTLLPLAAFVLLLIGGGVRALCRPYRNRSGYASGLFWACGGDTPLKTGAYIATVCMALSAVCGVVGLVRFLDDAGQPHDATEEREGRWAERTDWIRLGPVESAPPGVWEELYKADKTRPKPPPALALEVGYKIDQLTAVMFAMVTVIATLIFVFSLGYMRDETKEVVVDHEVPAPTSTSGNPHHPHAASPSTTVDGPKADGHDGHEQHLHRRGRYGRFFLYLSLFCFSMLNLVIADNLFQVFVSWELVGVCSFFLIGFNYERASASRAANKAFIVNRIGDAGFVIGILIAWTSLGTLNFDEMKTRLRSPGQDYHSRHRPHALALEGELVRVNPVEERDWRGNRVFVLPPKDQTAPGSHLALFPLAQHVGHFDGLGPGAGHGNSKISVPDKPDYTSYGAMPYWLFVVMGFGIFLGCVGKSAQVPLQTWLPDAMEGPTPVSALIHAATMVAAGVYLVGRFHPLFAPEVLLVIAYIGAFTLFISATIALVQTDIKRVLAYSTCSQLGFMMLALGLGGWVAGLLHLITHAFFKALLFLGSGSVIYGCHHEQDLRKMGGLKTKMPITAWTMFVGVLAISGAPLLSGWYSKDMIISAVMGYVAVNPTHIVLLVLPVVTAGMTAYYMFRLWFLAFTGKPRDQHVYDHARESPAVMTVPLIVLAVFSVCVAWGWPLWNAEASYLGHVLHKAEPASIALAFRAERIKEHELHLVAGLVALGVAAAGAALALWAFYLKEPSTAAMYAPGPAWYRFLLRKWYFDEAYDAAFVRPTVQLAHVAAAADKRPTEATHGPGDPPPPRRFDLFTLDGILNALGEAADSLGRVLRGAQTGYVRVYVLALALTAAGLLAMLAVLSR